MQGAFPLVGTHYYCMNDLDRSACAFSVALLLKEPIFGVWPLTVTVTTKQQQCDVKNQSEEKETGRCVSCVNQYLLLSIYYFGGSQRLDDCCTSHMYDVCTLKRHVLFQQVNNPHIVFQTTYTLLRIIYAAIRPRAEGEPWWRKPFSMILYYILCYSILLYSILFDSIRLYCWFYFGVISYCKRMRTEEVLGLLLDVVIVWVSSPNVWQSDTPMKMFMRLAWALAGCARGARSGAPKARRAPNHRQPPVSKRQTMTAVKTFIFNNTMIR